VKQTRIQVTVRPQRRRDTAPLVVVPGGPASDTSDAAALLDRIDRLVGR